MNMPQGSLNAWNAYQRHISQSEHISDCAYQIETDFGKKEPEIILWAHMELDGEELADFVSDVAYWSRYWFGETYGKNYNRRAFEKWREEY
ncbi:hypothetical protein [Wielerella bovis]|uniref:hypothetical protein n=1 Tax=Wielerella bovis TaxID=2917790 RepID=UPI002019FABC|nr:hypothetical protein [Wielerella bovis]ULJ60811.1 hypothetical protein MIS44_02815 [Wielerella bovis]ULJ68155.1 hypothetical protein MIS31_06400 [Wielerella bovis]